MSSTIILVFNVSLIVRPRSMASVFQVPSRSWIKTIKIVGPLAGAEGHHQIGVFGTVGACKGKFSLRIDRDSDPIVARNCVGKPTKFRVAKRVPNVRGLTVWSG